MEKVKDLCILCEAEGFFVESSETIEFNGDPIPVCNEHKEFVLTTELFSEDE